MSKNLKFVLTILAVPASWAPMIIWDISDKSRKAFEAAYGHTWFTVVWVLVVAFPIVTMLYVFGVTFIGPMLSFFGGSPTTRRILREGRSADATIKAIGENSRGGVVTVNDQPYLNLQLEVHDSYQAPYITSLDTIIPRSVLPQFQPGTILPIKIDPNDPMKVAIDWDRGQTQ
jgi:hypothetical protein